MNYFESDVLVSKIESIYNLRNVIHFGAYSTAEVKEVFFSTLHSANAKRRLNPLNLDILFKVCTNLIHPTSYENLLLLKKATERLNTNFIVTKPHILFKDYIYRGRVTLRNSFGIDPDFVIYESQKGYAQVWAYIKPLSLPQQHELLPNNTKTQQQSQSEPLTTRRLTKTIKKKQASTEI